MRSAFLSLSTINMSFASTFPFSLKRPTKNSVHTFTHAGIYVMQTFYWKWKVCFMFSSCIDSITTTRPFLYDIPYSQTATLRIPFFVLSCLACIVYFETILKNVGLYCDYAIKQWVMYWINGRLF